MRYLKLKNIILTILLFLTILLLTLIYYLNKQIVHKNKLIISQEEKVNEVESRIAVVDDNYVGLIENLNKKIEDNNKLLLQNNFRKNYRINNLFKKYIKDSNNIKKIDFKKFQNKLIKSIDKKFYCLQVFQSDSLFIAKAPYQTSSSYITSYKNNIFLVQGDGLFSYINTKDFNKQVSTPKSKNECQNNYDPQKNNNIFKANTIKSNIKDIITFNDFFIESKFGIKDIFIDNDIVYISYTNEYKKNCFNTSILQAKLSIDYLEFENFFVPDECVKEKNSYNEFEVHQSGGRIIKINENIIFSTGEYRNRDLAQNKNSLLGKIISININTRDVKVLSMGHRNVQGLLYEEKQDLIISTEHGPLGGDEINIQKNISNYKLTNFGWPISSYGEHYGSQGRPLSETKAWHEESESLKNKYLKAPLKKSHELHGFNEPIIYFTPSIAISEIINIPYQYNLNENKNNYFVSSLGNVVQDGDMTIHHIIFNDNFNVVEYHDKILINERIRDLFYYKNKEAVVMFLENTGSIGVLSFLD